DSPASGIEPVERLSLARERLALASGPRPRPSTQALRLRVATQAEPPLMRTISPFSSCYLESSLDFSNPVHNYATTRSRHRHSILPLYLTASRAGVEPRWTPVCP